MPYAAFALLLILLMGLTGGCASTVNKSRQHAIRVIVTSDGEVDDQCSLVRFLLYANEWDVEGIITSSSQYHWQGHNWAGDNWAQPYLQAYAKVYANLIQHDPAYPTPQSLRKITVLGNVAAEGDMNTLSEGAQLIVKTLLDNTDHRPIWLQAWGGSNTIARALKTIEQNHPERMEEVAKKIRLFLIWEQDDTYQNYILPHWGRYNILTIISDQFWAIAYQWNKILPKNKQRYFAANWMQSNILQNHGELCALYKAHEPGSYGLKGDTDFAVGDFRSEGDSPAFLHIIPTGLRNRDSPDFGGWGGRYIKVRDNTWLDPVPVQGYRYPEGRWYTRSAWGRTHMRDTYPEQPQHRQQYFKPLVRWTEAIQNDFAARADWSVKTFDNANHPPVVAVNTPLNQQVKRGETVYLSAEASRDPDGDSLRFRWWHYREAGSYAGHIVLQNPHSPKIRFAAPADAQAGDTVHIICEVSDSGAPTLTRYQRIVFAIQ